MSLVFNMVGGGGGSAELPAIYVTYPEGSICTCSNGSKTYTAKDTSGYWLFAGLEVGTWIVTISDPTGTHTDRSTTATISDAGEVVNVRLSYTLYLYKEGDEYTDITGGWVFGADNIGDGYYDWATGSGTMERTKNADNITLYVYRNNSPATSSAGASVSTQNPIDLSGCTELKLICETAGTFRPFEGNYYSYFAVASKSPGGERIDYFRASILGSSFIDAGSTEIVIDVSSINEGYVAVLNTVYGKTTVNPTIVIKEILAS